MKLLVAIYVALMVSAIHGFASPPALVSLPDPQSDKYKVGPYIAAAAELQKMGKASGCRTMLQAARNQPENRQIIVLCRMLFTKRRASEFKPPGLGGGIYLAGTHSSDWPLDPIALVDGVPFWITRGYDLAGWAGTSETYLQYCMAHCTWNSARYHQPTDEQMHAALAKLLASARWEKQPLKPFEKEFLSAQIE